MLSAIDPTPSPAANSARTGAPVPAAPEHCSRAPCGIAPVARGAVPRRAAQLGPRAACFGSASRGHTRRDGLGVDAPRSSCGVGVGWVHGGSAESPCPCSGRRPTSHARAPPSAHGPWSSCRSRWSHDEPKNATQPPLGSTPIPPPANRCSHSIEEIFNFFMMRARVVLDMCTLRAQAAALPFACSRARPMYMRSNSRCASW